MASPYTKLVENNSHCGIIDAGSDEQLEVFGYKQSSFKRTCFVVFTVLTFGFLLLLVRWYPVLKVWLTCVHCDLVIADIVIIKDSFGQRSVSKVENKLSKPVSIEFSNSPMNESIQSTLYQEYSNNSNSSVKPKYYRYFVYRCIRFIWNDTLKCFERLRGYNGIPVTKLLEGSHGLSDLEHEFRYNLYGPNLIDIEVKSYFRLFIEEVLNPFYIFQIASVILWCVDNYIYYAVCITLISLISIAVSLYQTKKQSKTLRDMVSLSNAECVTLFRGGRIQEDVSSMQLVPGDIIVIPPNGCLMSCDAVLINGNCIVNESMLTGESVPETKTPLLTSGTDALYSSKQHKKHTLFSGTRIIQTRYYGSKKVVAVVVKTGFDTIKGELVRSILFPRPVGFKFYSDAIKFVVVLFCISLIGMAYSLYTYVLREESIKDTIIRTLDIVTIVVPPALPAAMTIGTVYAQNRLKKQGLYCISPPRINIGGKLKLICFDKTGTLTEEGMDLWGVLPSFKGSFQDLKKDVDEVDDHSPLKAAMACCHSLTVIEGELRGDPLDLKMFNSTKWNLEEPGTTDTSKYDLLAPTVVRPSKGELSHPLYKSADSESLPVNGISYITGGDNMSSSTEIAKEQFPLEIGILRQFPFSPELQMMSVISRTLEMNHMDLYVKGAPEKIASLCLSDTVPCDFTSLLQKYTVQGYRVIAIAWRALDPALHWHQAQKIKRDEVEYDLVFLGLLIMQNALKPVTVSALQTLHRAKIRTIMVTGDNLLTAMSVARECNMIPSMDRITVLKAFPPEERRAAKVELQDSELHCNDNNLVTSEKNNELEGSHSVHIDGGKYFHFATDGKSFAVIRTHFPKLLQKLLVRGTVFARMAPEQKTQIVEGLQELGYTVGMCGDGANDCGALKAADVGISLSEAEASVAAPFTSNIPNIDCVSIVIREGRCALVTSFSMFKFIALYSLIQFTATLILYTVDSNLTDSMFLYSDLAIVTTLATVMSYTRAYDKLVEHHPNCSLISIYSISSLLFQTLLVIGFQILTIVFLQDQIWCPAVIPSSRPLPSWHNSSVFLVSCFQYIIMAVVFSKGPPYRKPFYNNFWFTGALILLTLFTALLLFNPYSSLANFFQIIWHDFYEQFNFRLTLLLFVGCNFILSIAIELFVVESNWLEKAVRVVTRKKKLKRLYKQIEEEIQSTSTVLPYL